MSEMLVPAAEAHGCGFGKGVNRRIAPFLGEWSVADQAGMPTPALRLLGGVDFFQRQFHPSLFKHLRRGGRNRGFQKSLKLFTQNSRQRGLELCWLKPMLLRVAVYVRSSCTLSLAARGWFPFSCCRLGTLCRAACVLGVIAWCTVESGWKINAGRCGAQRGW